MILQMFDIFFGIYKKLDKNRMTAKLFSSRQTNFTAYARTHTHQLYGGNTQQERSTQMLIRRRVLMHKKRTTVFTVIFEVLKKIQKYYYKSITWKPDEKKQTGKSINVFSQFQIQLRKTFFAAVDGWKEE